jgi:hypothetical protein
MTRGYDTTVILYIFIDQIGDLSFIIIVLRELTN